ncbi:unnamed protein product [Macrosiphum euphorbiae]|uniref:Uncharacterized protein n=1 Tax=Macrosiphum euphorbiae TaxID=13131 RepID=A0AAV0VK85_9HEMI|nr:unnamed protein product [Macrosiphum euphorbiae]
MFEWTGSTEKLADKTINRQQTTTNSVLQLNTEQSSLLQFFRVWSLGGSVRITTETEWKIGDTDFRKVNRCILSFEWS